MYNGVINVFIKIFLTRDQCLEQARRFDRRLNFLPSQTIIALKKQHGVGKINMPTLRTSALKIIDGFEDDYNLCSGFYVQFMDKNIFSKDVYIYLILI